MSLYSFYADKCFIDPSDRTVNLEQLDIPAGYLDREMIEHFVEPLEIADIRTDRLEIDYRPSTYQPLDDSVLIEDVLFNIVPAGLAQLAEYPANTVTVAQYTELDYTIFEGEILPANPVRITSVANEITFDATELTQDEATAINNLSDNELEFIFNTIEYLFYGIIPSDTLEQIDTFLLNDPLFTNYIATTVRVSSLHTAVAIYGDIDIHRFVPKWVEFGYNKDGITLTFTVWIDRNAFVTGYPLFTVQTITPPLALDLLLDPSGIEDPLEAAALSRDQITDSLLPTVVTDDQVGMSFRTRYIWNNTTHYLSFTLLYRGRTLSPLDARIAIKEYLLASGEGSEALWSVRFPDIFTKANKWFVPNYHRTTSLPIGPIYPSTIELEDLKSHLDHFAGIVEIALTDNIEVLTCAYANFFVGCINSDTDETDSFYGLHPTYVDASSTDIGFDEMDENTKQMSLVLNNVLAIADGQVNNSTYAEIILYGLKWYMFVVDGIAYYVLDKTSYLTSVAGM